MDEMEKYEVVASCIVDMLHEVLPPGHRISGETNTLDNSYDVIWQDGDTPTRNGMFSVDADGIYVTMDIHPYDQPEDEPIMWVEVVEGECFPLNSPREAVDAIVPHLGEELSVYE